MEVKVLRERQDAHLVYVKCRNCQTGILAVMLVNNLGISSVGLVTDLNSDDILKFIKMEQINLDEVIEIHQVLSRQKALIDQIN